MSDEINERDVIDKSDLPNRGKYAIGQALPLLIFTLCTIGFGSIFAIRNFIQLNDTATVLDATAVVCGGNPAASATTYDRSDRIHPVVIFRELIDGRLIADNSLVPEEWYPAEPSKAELVLCIQADRIAYRNICNESGGNSGLNTEYGRELTVELRVAQTGALLQEGVITSVDGAPPPEICLPEAPAELPPQTPVTPAQIQAWLQPFVAP